jgi:hypothetical protein
MKPFADMRLDQYPNARGNCPAIELLIFDLVDNSNDNIIILERLETPGKALSLGGIELGQPSEIFIKFGVGILAI